LDWVRVSGAVRETCAAPEHSPHRYPDLHNSKACLNIDPFVMPFKLRGRGGPWPGAGQGLVPDRVNHLRHIADMDRMGEGGISVRGDFQQIYTHAPSSRHWAAHPDKRRRPADRLMGPIPSRRRSAQGICVAIRNHLRRYARRLRLSGPSRWHLLSQINLPRRGIKLSEGPVGPDCR